MAELFNLSDLEKKAFKSIYADGFWDMLIGVALFLFMVGPILVSRFGFGDFWSAFIFLPVYLGVLWLFKIAKISITSPRLGVVKIGSARRRKIRGLQLILVVILIIGIILGLVMFSNTKNIRSINWFFPGVTCFIFMFIFTMASIILSIRRFLIYGVLLCIFVPVGEILFSQGLVRHHGFPLAFGSTAIIIIVVGIVNLISFLKKYPLPEEDTDGSG